MCEDLKFLFPYEKVPYGSTILIYGAGKMGQSYLRQMLMTHYCHVVALADKNHSVYGDMVVPVCNPKDIHRFKFDYVVIALRAQTDVKEFYDNLHEQGIKDEHIIYVKERIIIPDIYNDITGDKSSDAELNMIQNRGNVAISMMGGVGDYIVQKKFVEMMLELDASIKIDIFCSRNIDFLKFLYSDTKQINSIMYNLGTRFETLKTKYNVAIEMFGTGMSVKFECLNNNNKQINNKLYKVLKNIKKNTDKVDIDITKPIYIECFRSIYRGENCFKRLKFGESDLFIKEYVHIPEGKESIQEYMETKLSRYITVNFGNGNTHNTMRVAKSWPKANFEKVIAGIKREYPDIEIVQIGAKGADLLSGVDRTFFGKSFSLVSQILKNAMLHIDIEGGMVHLATNLGTKCIVLFGPTQIEYYGYKQNINIKAGNCHNCCGLYPDVNKCARGMEEPECMYSITPDLVLKKLNKYLSAMDVCVD